MPFKPERLYTDFPEVNCGEPDAYTTIDEQGLKMLMVAGGAAAVGNVAMISDAADNKVLKGTAAGKARAVGVFAEPASADGAKVLVLILGKIQGIASGSITRGDRLVAADDGKVAAANTHKHTITVETDATPEGAALYFHAAGVAGSTRLEANPGGTDDTSTQDTGTIIGKALSSAADGAAVTIWVNVAG